MELQNQTLKKLIVVWAAALAVMCVLTAVSWYQAGRVDPLESPVLSITLEKIEKDPQNAELRDQFRALDLLARKAYFTSRGQVRTGGILIVIFTVLLVFTIKTYRNRTGCPVKPGEVPGMDRGGDDSDRRMFRTVGLAGMAGAFVALIMIFAMDGSWQSPLRGSDAGGSVAGDIDHGKVWQNFRGPGSWGVSRTGGAPVSWNGETGENIVWKTAVPVDGFSSPVVWNDKIFMTGADEKARMVMAFDFETGKLLWQKTVADTFDEVAGLEMPEDAGFAAPTSVIDKDHVWSMFGTGILVCHTHAGEQVWEKYLGAPDNRYGHSSSLLLRQGLVYVQYDHDGEQNLFAFRGLTGEKMWQQPRKEISWSSPALVPTPSGAALILTAVPSVDAYDAATGAVLWSLPKVLRGEVGPSAAWNGELIMIANEYAVAAGIKPDWKAGTAEVVWENDDNLPSTSSPAAGKDFMILAGAEGEVTCHNTADGKLVWDHEFDEGFYASPVIVEDRVYLQDREGTMRIFALAGEYKELGSCPMGEKTNATPAFLGETIILRGAKHLFRIGK